MQNADMKVRLPADLKDWLKARSEDNCRTMNGEILALLKATKRADSVKDNVL